jgi:hypothetical protein
MLFLLNSTIYLDFTTHDPTTGGVSDADSTPSVSVFEDDGSTSMYNPTVTKRAGQTGVYTAKIIATKANGFGLGKSYNVIADATVNSIQGKACIRTFQLDLKFPGDIIGLEEGSSLAFDVKGRRIRIKRVSDVH